MYGKPNIVTIIEVQRLERAGHLVRMSNDSLKMKLFLRKMDEEDKQGRSKLRWLHCIENELKLMGVNRLTKKA